MKRLLCIIISLNLVVGGKTFADDSLTGLHLGLGLNVVADEYKSDVDVLGNAKYASGDKWTFTGPTHNFETVLAKQEIKDITTGQTFTFTQNKQKYDGQYFEDDKFLLIIPFNEYGFPSFSDKASYFLQNDDSWQTDDCTRLPSGVINLKKVGDKYNLSIDELPFIRSGNLTVALVDHIINNKTINGCNNDTICYEELNNQTVSFTNSIAPKKTGKMNSVSGEMKFSYFHNLFKDLYVGIDVSGNISSNHKKNIAFDNSSDGIKDKYYIYYDENLHDSTAEHVTVEYDKTQRKFTSISRIDGIDIENSGSTVDNFFHANLNENQDNIIIPERTYTILKPNDIENTTFEKNKFNSRAAVVLGAQYKGWFAGVRGGVSYNQGKLHVKDSTGTSSEEVSFASPFVGVHLMKSVNMKGLENGHIYVTADVNVENKQRLNMRGIKNVKHNSVNVSLGMTWQIN